PQQRATPADRLQVLLFIVGSAILPAAKDDADPFVGQCPHRCVVRLVLGALLLVVSLSPFALAKRLAGKFVEGLAQELGAGPTEMSPLDFAAGCLDGSDPTVALHLIGAVIAFATRSKGSDQ